MSWYGNSNERGRKTVKVRSMKFFTAIFYIVKQLFKKSKHCSP